MNMKAVGIVVIAAIVSAVVVTGIQEVLLDEANAGVTGGVTGAVCAVIAMGTVGAASKKEDEA